VVNGSANRFLITGSPDIKDIGKAGWGLIGLIYPAFLFPFRVLPREYDSGMRNMLYYYLQGVPTIRTFLTAKKSF
jgi:hypothetical protein